MAEIDTSILLQASGGSESAQEIQKASTALDKVSGSSVDMGKKFQDKFQHIGLMLFAGDALRASGLGRETRMVVGLLNMTMQETSAVAGISAGSFMLVVTALAAVVGMVSKAIAHHKEEAEAIHKVTEAQTKSLDGYQKEIAALETIQASGHGMTRSMEALLLADQAVADHIKNNLLINMGKEEVALEHQISQLHMSQVLHDAWAKALEVISQKLSNLIPGLTGVVQGVKLMVDYFSHLAGSLAQHAQLTGTLKQKYLELEQQLASVKSHHEAMRNGVIQNFDDMVKSEHKAYESWQKDINDTVTANDKALKRANEAHQKSFEELGKLSNNIATQIGSDFGDAFARSLVEGKSFTDQMKHAFRSMAEHIISDIIQMTIKWMILNAVSHGAAGTFGSFASHYAIGGQVMVDRPTLFMAGEGGPELATFQPLSAMSGGGSHGGGSGGGNSPAIGQIYMPITINGVNDTDKIAREVGQKIIQQVRGAGQLNFVRA